MQKKLFLILLLFIAIIAHAKEQVLVLSGGDNPSMNHYSQYLQTKLLYENLLTRYPFNQVSLFFGAGNNTLSQLQPLDVHKVIQGSNDKTNKTDVMLTGIIDHNKVADKTNILTYFLSPQIQSMKASDRLLLFVSDHGMPNLFLQNKKTNPYSNNCINLWHYDKLMTNNFINYNNFYKTCLSKNELSALLSTLPSKHIVFEMSQCYSGGFHQLSVAKKGMYPTANPKICGFTAVTADHFASGCTPDANGATYQGYERSFTEWYTGQDVVTGKRIRTPAKTIFAAHQNAVLEDMTVDIPLSTSNYYLLKWADLFMSSKFKSRVNNYDNAAIKIIWHQYKDESTHINNANLQNFINLTHALEQKITQLNTKAIDFTALPLEKQTQHIRSLEQQIEQREAKLETITDGMMTIYLNLLMPAWNKAISQQEVPNLSTTEYQFEKELYQPMVKRHLYKKPFHFDIYYLQYLSAKKNDPALIQYNKERNHLIKKWASAVNQPAIVNAIDRYESLKTKHKYLQEIIDKEEKSKQLLKRVLIYNKIIAAWVILLKIDDKVALKELNGLLECELTS